jgi:hypothetical protein
METQMANVKVVERGAEHSGVGQDEVADKKPSVSVGDGSVTVRLHKPVNALGKMHSELTFREPTARDIYEVGNPVDVDPRTGGMKFDPVIGAEMMSRLAGVPVGTITNQMSAKDWLSCQWRITPFFVPQGEPAPTDSTS